MCGIVGFLDLKTRFGRDGLCRIVTQMADELVPRGPDDSGVFTDEPAGLALGFRRLAIIDLSAAGHQPMVSASGRHIIVFNGEVYNSEVLRADLLALGHTFRGHSDTEVLLEAIGRWGLEVALERSVGMFALAVYDRERRELMLARDRFGKKPLYYGMFGDCLMFASQPRAFRLHPLFTPELDLAAFSGYVRLGYVKSTDCIYSGVRQVEPGCFLRVGPQGRTTFVRYWSARDIAGAGKRHPIVDETDALIGLKEGLTEAVRDRLVSDVPLGAFLSGGIDSSLVVALMQKLASTPVKTFTIGFNEPVYDEAPFARKVANHLGTDHYELYLSASDALAVVPKLPDIYDEPFADSSQIPTWLVSSFARQTVTVVLSGDGGDELFAGYSRYRQISTMTGQDGGASGWHLLALSVRHAHAPRLQISKVLVKALRNSATVLMGRWPLAARSLEERYRAMVSQGFDPATVLLRNEERIDPLWRGALAMDFPRAVERAQMIDTLTYLPGDILTKVDRASMAVSLEVRAPLLDHRVMRYAWSLPISMKIRKGEQKWALKQLLREHLPSELFDRPKRGFGIPIDHWLRGALRDWAEDLLDARKLEVEGLFDAAVVRGYWKRHLAGESWQYPLWCVLMFQAWRRRWMDSARAADTTHY